MKNYIGMLKYPIKCMAVEKISQLENRSLKKNPD